MKVGESRFKDLYRAWLWGPWRSTAAHVPPGAEVRAHRLMGRVTGQLWWTRRQRLRSHLMDALGPDPKLQSWVTEIFATHFANQYVGFSFPKVTSETREAYLECRGLTHVDEALSQGRGVVVAHPHMGLPQLPLHGMGILGYPVHQVGQTARLAALSEKGKEVARIREQLESEIQATLHDGRRFLRPLIRALKRNEVVFTVCDATGGGTEIGRRDRREVTGRWLDLPVFPIWLAQKTGALVCPMATWRNRERGALFVAEFGPCLDLADEKEPHEVGMHAMSQWLDGWLRAHPGDWHFWDQWHDGPGGLIREAP